MREIIRIFKAIPKLDSQIRTIEILDKMIVEGGYIVKVGLYESLGEQGEILTLIYDNYPTEEEIINEVKLNLKEAKKEITNSILSCREEKYKNILNRLVM